MKHERIVMNSRCTGPLAQTGYECEFSHLSVNLSHMISHPRISHKYTTTGELDTVSFPFACGRTLALFIHSVCWLSADWSDDCKQHLRRIQRMRFLFPSREIMWDPFKGGLRASFGSDREGKWMAHRGGCELFWWKSTEIHSNPYKNRTRESRI